ncbi:MAG: hypothetical protein NXY57DRAFT_969817 [Lentinula lateritia]|nr:MAG: hypothetical protein NXY57DRAFT_969817 [Lentinula lateritia]
MLLSVFEKRMDDWIHLPNTTPALRYSSGVNTPAFSEFFEVRGFPDELMLTVHRNGITKINTLLPNNQGLGIFLGLR